MDGGAQDSYRVLLEGGQGEYVEKKSRFIATLRRCESVEEAMGFVEEMKKKYWDARHNCYAFCIGPKGELTRCSDDGEPGGTAGRPMLDVLLGEGVHNVCVVVTRYFGGTLLGTGGLVRAYSGAVKEGLKNSVILNKRPGKKVSVTCDYNGLGKLQYIAGQMKLPVLDTEYTDQVVSRLMLPEEDADAFMKRLTEATGGKALIETFGTPYFADNGGKILLFEE